MSAEFDWDYLMAAVSRRRVVPVVGRGLLHLGPEHDRMPLEAWLAHALAEKLGVPAPEDATVSGVARLAGRAGRPRQDIYRYLFAALKDGPPVDEAPLRALAEIDDLSLFVTTSYDSTLTRVLNDVRGNGNKVTRVLSYNAFERRGQDLDVTPTPKAPVVYHLFGEAQPWPDFAATEQDTIEFIQALQAASVDQLGRLFDALRDHFLLVVGTEFPDWLARFFVRTLRGQSFLEISQRNPPFFADRMGMVSKELSSFFRDYNVLTNGIDGPDAFVSELHRRWKRDAGTSEAATTATEQQGSIFLSYAREDAETVRAVREALLKLNLKPWMDEKDIEPGADWAETFRLAVERCALFVPFISNTTERASDGYFFQEWRIASEVAERRPPNRPFIIPTIIDGLTTPEVIPRAFRDPNWVWLEPNAVDEYAQKIRAAYRQLMLARTA